MALLGLCLLLAALATQGATQTKSKRQIYREQVLPSSGGKIPEGAFRADRLALNRLNKEGISVPDGMLLDHRHVHAHPHEVKHDPEDEDSIVKIIQTPDHRYTPPEGTYHNERPLTVSSTYIIRKPIGREETNIRTPEQQMPLHEALGLSQRHHYRPPPPAHYHSPPPVHYHSPPQHLEPYYPIPVPFELPNKELQASHTFRDHPDTHVTFEDPDKELQTFDIGYEEPDIPSDIDWSFLLGRYTQLAGEINNGLVPQDSFRYSAPHSFFISPDVVPGLNFFYSNRLPRKSAEETLRKGSESIRKSYLKLRCASSSTKCQVFNICQVQKGPGGKAPPCPGYSKCPEGPRQRCLPQGATAN